MTVYAALKDGVATKNIPNLIQGFAPHFGKSFSSVPARKLLI